MLLLNLYSTQQISLLDSCALRGLSLKSLSSANSRRVASSRVTFLVHIRFMRSSSRMLNALKRQPPVNGSSLKPYANYTINDRDYNSNDPKAKTNNPLIGKTPHKEIHRTRCVQPGCTGTFCIGLCNHALDRKAIGHATHGHAPAKEVDKTTVLGMKGRDFSGKPKDQNLVFYKNAHDVSETSCDTKATLDIQKDTLLQQTIKQYEDKK